MIPQTAALPAPDPAAAAHSRRLTALIRAELDAAGSLPFERFMELALYAPGLGYYRCGTAKFGPGGDFVTAPELSPLFSRCLARQCAEILERTGGDILELGAGSGVMAADMLAGLDALHCLPQRYAILELSAELRHRQQQTINRRVPQLAQRVRWLDRLPEGFRGVMVGNEVADALPVQRFRLTAAGPRPLHVAWDNGFVWHEGPADGTLTAAVEAIQDDLKLPLPPGYESEISLRLPAWLSALAASLTVGVLLLIDYGYPRREYYHPQRAAGTLLCHYRHRVHADPFVLVGLQDITASIDFTALADAADAAGLRLAGYASQSWFLLGCGLPELLAGADPGSARYMDLARQAKLLTLPGEMGGRFKAMALSRGVDGPLRGFAAFDESGRL
ncbi:MAG: SAM-dependent methyltransferase [Pseudomonadota bacterium]|nr:SAM-dependent methyltransferase [Pseudomonadota bacterium]